METQQRMNSFVGLSVVLTGFNKSVIAPSIDPINIKAEYYPKFINENSGKTKNNIPLYDAIFNQFDSLKSQGKTDQEIGEAILSNSDFEMPCRKLIFLWYSGAWPEIVPATEYAPETTASQMLSAKSYTQGLAWQVMQSHPMGDSNYRYGYWADEPADLSGYTGNNN